MGLFFVPALSAIVGPSGQAFLSRPKWVYNGISTARFSASDKYGNEANYPIDYILR